MVASVNALEIGSSPAAGPAGAAGLKDRVGRERHAHDEQSIDRRAYQGFLSHADNGPHRHRRLSLIRGIMAACAGRTAIEIGSVTWADWIDWDTTEPARVVCVNISRRELLAGRDLAHERGRLGPIRFVLSDAHSLGVADASVDAVFGSDVLHHLDYETSLREIRRVLKPGGFMLFKEPLLLNPVAQLVRLLTPRSRTVDECPLGPAELRMVSEIFETRMWFYQMFSVPAGILSRLIFHSPVNPLTRAADSSDVLLDRILPFLRPYFRSVLIHGVKPAAPSVPFARS